MRLRLPLEGLTEGRVRLPREAVRYAVRVHRLRPGDRLLAFDPATGLEAEAELTLEGSDYVALVEAPRPAPRPARSVTLLQAIGKGDKVDAVVRDATELGATRVVAILTERGVARPSEGTKTARWRRIAVEAARQAGRGDAPEVSGPAPLPLALEALGLRAPDELRAVLDPRSDVPLGRLVAALAPGSPAVLAVGPEGGFTEEELASVDAAGFVRARLGAFVMRTETVCAAALGALAAWDEPS